MPNPLTLELEHSMLADLYRLAAEREAAEKRVRAEFIARNEAADKEFKATRERLDKQIQTELAATQREFDETLARAETEYTTEHATIQTRFDETKTRVTDKFETFEKAHNKQLEQDSWQATTVFEASHPGLLEQYNLVEAKINGNGEALQAVVGRTWQFLEICQQTPAWLARPLEDRPASWNDPFKELPNCVAAANQQVDRLRRLAYPKLFIGVRAHVLGVTIFIVSMVTSKLLIDGHPFRWLGVGAAVAALCIVVGLWLIFRSARSQTAAVCLAIRKLIADGEKYKERCHVEAKAFYDSQRAKMAERHRREIREANARHLTRMTDAISERDGALTENDDTYHRREAQIVERRDVLVRSAHARFPNLLDATRGRHERDQADAKTRFERLMRESQAQHDADYAAMAARWREGMERVYATVAEINAENQRLFPEWNDSAWKEWKPPTAPPPALRFGDFTVRLDQVPSAISTDERLQPPGPTVFTLPALLPFPKQSSLLIQAAGEGRTAAVHVLKAVMLRMLATIPPGKVRFTIIDHVGRGENFAGFMHLADYDDVLVTNRIWTEPQQIEARLADLTEQMENVIQKYLRNDFETIAEYNEFAGEVAEAFRILVVANFPAGFTEAAAQRLTSIAASGARCGVYVLMTTDSGQPLPMRFDMKDIESRTTNLLCDDSTVQWREAQLAQFGSTAQQPRKKQMYRIWKSPNPFQGIDGVLIGPASDDRESFGIEPGKPLKMLDEFEAESYDEALDRWLAKTGKPRTQVPFALAVDTPPPDERFTQIVKLVGENAKDSRRVEVPFEYIAPAADKYWAGSTAHGINVPLGRAGATKLQHLRLGHGTSQHVLIAGKTGSGKSTLLHALVTNLALTYSPDEIELYLIDFKKGVEFKTYATHALPHARVIAIESEREFGLSVLQSLDGELRRRGDMFRTLGVQDLAGYRLAEPEKPLPRILLVVDEFHELFVEDDKLAQEAALMLDRLVRQGRAFGIHVMLGSQTLGGAYSLARSTIGQMAVRIALQCSENDAHLILSEDNSAARLLSRPGEAIYNDANGMIIGNNPFQVVWLSDERREVYLERIHEMALARDPHWAPQQIVFEGNVPADVSRNHLLQRLLLSESWPEPLGDASAWLGEAIAIKDPTAAVFRHQNGCNLLLIGQRDEAASGIMATALLSLAAQQLPAEGVPHNGRKRSAEAKFYLLEASRADRSGATLAQLADVVGLPHQVRIGGRRDVPAIIAEIAEEVARRQSGEPADAPQIFLFVYDLARFRDLRRSDEIGYSFGSEQKQVSTGTQFSDILREGPAVGVFTIVWCDTLNNLNRTVDRQGIREFDLRVLFQMSGTDSSNLIDTPLASKLGPHLALFYNEEEGRTEKFRPYAWPTEAWLAWARERLHARRPAAEHSRSQALPGNALS